MIMQWKYIKTMESTDQISEFEKLTGFSFPKDFTDCVLKNNGGRPEPATFDTDKNKGRAIKHLLSFNREDRESIWDISEWNKDDLSDKYVAFAIDDAGNLICFDKADNKVVFINHENPAAIERVAESFADYLNKLYE